MNNIKNAIIHLSYFSKCILFVIGSMFLITSCANEQSSSNYRPPLGGAIGKTSEIVVIADDNVWEGPAGDTLRYYFGSAYLILPQPESIFDLRHLTPAQLENNYLLKELRTYIFLGNFSDEHSETNKIIKKTIGDEKVARATTDPNFHTVVGQNKWARGQLLSFIFANSQDKLAENIKASYPTIAKRINDFDQPQIGNMVYVKGLNQGVQKVIKEKTGADMQIPQEYFVALDEENTIWLRKETSELSSNIFIHKLPYVSQDQFTKEGIKAIRNSLGEKYVRTEIEGAYMKTNDKNLPMFLTTMEINGNYAAELRGIWDLKNDFMGGPFIGYLIHNKSTNELLYLDAFIHAPTTTKRQYMQQVEHILRKTKFGKVEEAAAVSEE